MQGFLELWGEGETWEELEASIRAFPEELKQPWLQPNLSMKVGIFFKYHVFGLSLIVLAMHVGFLLHIAWLYVKVLSVRQVVVDGWGRVISLEEQIKCHDRLEFIPFQARPL